ncbi:MAG: hydroxymethylbilane synthase [Planctomycetota bacterium]|nr:hydroxymethylbilane synthase [Planctomycetota bacterium]
MNTKVLRIGTRGSQLARTQSGGIAQQLMDAGIPCELVEISTHADRTSGPIAGLGTQGVFTKEIQEALLRHEIDLAVHSLKDLTTRLPNGLRLVCTPPRANPFDAVVCDRGEQLVNLPHGARIGTGSPRRRAQLLAVRSDFAISDLRGNVDTRLRKLREGEFDAIILAAAGLERLGLHAEATEVLPPHIMLPAVGQGTLGLEAREDDAVAEAAAKLLHHAPTFAASTAERSLLAALQGGCLAPIAAWARLTEVGTSDSHQLRLTGVVLHPSGTPHLFAESDAAMADADALGRHVAKQLLDQGAAELVQASRR